MAGGGAAVVRPRLQNRMSYWRWCFPTRDEVWGVGGNVLAICGVQDRKEDCHDFQIAPRFSIFTVIFCAFLLLYRKTPKIHGTFDLPRVQPHPDI